MKMICPDIYKMNKQTCTWTNNEDGYYETSCGLEWCMTNDEGLKKNDMTYCPKCGKKIKDKK